MSVMFIREVRCSTQRSGGELLLNFTRQTFDTRWTSIRFVGLVKQSSKVDVVKT